MRLDGRSTVQARLVGRMNPWVLVPCGFGLWWLVSGISALRPLSGWLWALLVTAAVLVAACGLRRRQGMRIIDRRAFRIGVLAESGGIGIVVLSSTLSHRPDLIMPLVGAVVGLHLLPVARAFADRRLALAGGLLAGVCLTSLWWAPPVRTAIAGIGAGVVLWGCAVWTSLQEAMPAERSSSRSA
jgi:hypothetical protein